MVKLLLDKGAEVNAQGGKYGNALQAASLGGHEQVVKLLLNKGANIDTQGGHFGNALYAAAYAGNVEVLEPLISKCNFTQLQDPYDRTLLWWAAAGGQTSTVQVLISRYDYDSQVADKSGRTPLWIAKKKGHRAVSEVLLKESSLIEPGRAVSPDHGNDWGTLQCDVCTSSIRATGFYYHCGHCFNEDWVVCEDCRTSGASCAGETHTLVKRISKDEEWDETTC